MQFYTVLSNWVIFKAVFDLMAPSLPTSLNLFMFLMKLKLNCFDEDVGYYFSATFSRNLHEVLDVNSYI